MQQKKLSNPYHLANYTNIQLTALVLLRVLIGWHFLYEGLVKLFNPYWTSAGYLLDSKWIFSGLFKSIVASQTALKIVDFLNVWGLIAIGLGLMVGCLARAATIAGIVLLLFYYLCNPPFIGYTYTAPTEGSYLMVNKNLVEMCALFVLAVFPNSKLIGLDRLIFRKKKEA
ncbi:MAG: DoxX family membrane protein [Candidatus Aminicenantes bacterium]|nr:DoxX family membrane protein [Candidatus Aminicenantes bacterium]